MNNKMAKNTYLSTIECKKQTKQRRTETESWIQRAFSWLPNGKGYGGMGEEVRGLRSTNMQLQNSHGDVKYSTANGGAKELICMAHGHEQWCGDCLRDQGMLGGRGQRGKIGTTVIA